MNLTLPTEHEVRSLMETIRQVAVGSQSRVRGVTLSAPTSEAAEHIRSRLSRAFDEQGWDDVAVEVLVRSGRSRVLAVEVAPMEGRGGAATRAR